MTENRSRRMTISDIMILIAVVGFALLGAPTVVAFQRLPPNWRGLWYLQGSIWVALTGTLALIPLRLTPPRPRRHRLWSQPGWLAAVAIALTLVICLAQQLLKVSLGPMHGSSTTPDEFARTFFLETTYRLPFEGACAVSVLWIVLVASGRWRPEPSWIDRLGRLLGWYWVSFPLVDWVVAIP